MCRFKNNYFINFQDDGRSYQNENPMIAATNTSFNQFMEQVNKCYFLINKIYGYGQLVDRCY